MADFDDFPMSDPEPEEPPVVSTPAPVIPIVDIPTAEPPPSPSQHGDDQSTARDSPSEEETETGQSEVDSERPPSTRRKTRRKKKRLVNGVDMTPPSELLRKAERRAKKYRGDKKVDECIAELVRCTALSRVVYGDGDWRLAEAHTNLAAGYLELRGLAPQAQQHAETARSILLGGVHTSHSSETKARILEVLVNMHLILGRALTSQKKFREAEHSLNRASKVCEERLKVPGLNRLEQADLETRVAIAQGKLYLADKNPSKAARFMEKAEDLIKENHGEDSVQLIPVYQDLGRIEQSKGDDTDHDKAVEYFLQAHSISGASYESGSVEIGKTAYALAMAYSASNIAEGEASAETYLEECVGIYQVTYGPHHPETLRVQDQRCRLLVRMGKQEEALEALRFNLRPKMSAFGEYSEEVAESYQLSGTIRLTQGNMEPALKSLKKAHMIQSNLFGAGHKKAKATQQLIDMITNTPSVAAKQTSTDSKKPHFSAIVGRNTQLGGFKTVLF
ncbi:PREDICTED: tetratricopeptide repeat protein 23-like [Branchiostoma belcheri]|uniref:Tetratricopeptide repeat protein 23-like n=1 Tax=Branchiostoma belcheri TaxID=7741 RepID=A0A6P5ABP8_BRABE|nr:PREDICTED: tetratricopeptide repeat protein 23-like [Branchiostoma belcheri]